MELLLDDFLKQMSNPDSVNAREFLKLIRETIESGRNIWLLDKEKKRVAIVIPIDGGTFGAQNIV